MPVHKDFKSDAEFEEALRDWFAGQALNGMLSLESDLGIVDFTNHCYKIADNMLEARCGL